MLNLKVVNLYAGPGAGKSTTAAGLFNLMKHLGHKVELVTEFAKDATYQRDLKSLENQLVVLAEQDQRLRRLEGTGVEWAITDSPLPLCLAYMTREYEDWLEDAIWGAFDRYQNYNVWVDRVKPYATYGRNQTEHEALTLDLQVRDIFHEARDIGEDNEVDEAFTLTVSGDQSAPYEIVRWLGLEGAE